MALSRYVVIREIVAIEFKEILIEDGGMAR